MLLHDVHVLLLGYNSQSFQFNHNSVTVSSQIEDPYIDDFVQLALLLKNLNSQIENNNDDNNNNNNNNNKDNKDNDDIYAFSPIIIALNATVDASLKELQNTINNVITDTTSLSLLRHKLDDWFTLIPHIYYLIILSRSNSLPIFLSELYSFSKLGDDVISSLSLNYFKIISKPYFSSISNWLFAGILDENDKTPYFFSSNKFIKENTPRFISISTAEKIFHIGSAINFLKSFLNDSQWCNEFYENNYNNQTDLLKTDIESLYKIVISHLNSLLLPIYLSEINFLHRFLLTFNGDLTYSILVNGSSILKNNASSLSSNQLMSILQKSLDSSSISTNLPKDVFNRLDARLLNINIESSSAIDFFTLDYKVLTPVNSIISSSYKEYLRSFNILFKLSNLKYKLSSIWKQSSIIHKKITSRKIIKYQRKFHLIHLQFNSFIDHILFYITNEIISNNIHTFNNKFTSTIPYSLHNNKLLPLNIPNETLFNLQQLTSIHEDYITKISRSDLFYSSDDVNVPLNQILYHLLTIIENFTDLFNEFQTSIFDFIQWSNASNQTQQDLSKFNSLFTNKFESLYNSLSNKIVIEFEKIMTIFINQLSISHVENLQLLSKIIE